MEARFQIFLILLAVLAGTALLARRINVAPAILLLLAGIALAFVPGVPSLELPPELVLLLVLPPLIYSASVAMSWREFKFNLRPIILLAVGASASCSAPLSRRPTWSHCSPSPANWACRGESLSCSKGKGWPMTPPR